MISIKILLSRSLQETLLLKVAVEFSSFTATNMFLTATQWFSRKAEFTKVVFLLVCDSMSEIERER